METPVYAAERRRPVSRRGLGSFLILTGSVLVALGAVFAFLCGSVLLDACLPFEAAALSVAGLGLILVIFGLPLFFTRWQFARRLAFCPSCGADTGRGDRFCHGCGNRLW